MSPAFAPSVAPPKIVAKKTVAQFNQLCTAAAYRHWFTIAMIRCRFCQRAEKNAHSATLLATEIMLSPCAIRHTWWAIGPSERFVTPIGSVRPRGFPPGVTHQLPFETAAYDRNSSNRSKRSQVTSATSNQRPHRGSLSAWNQQHAIVRVIGLVSSNFFSRTSFGENRTCVR